LDGLCKKGPIVNKIFLVLKNEVLVTIVRRSFLFTAFGIPLITTLVFAGVSIINRGTYGGASSAVEDIFNPQTPKSQKPEGYVDQSGLIKSIPTSIPQGSLKAFLNEAAAHQALEAGEISAYYVIPEDYLASGDVTYVRPDFNPLSAFDQAAPIRFVLRENLLGGNERLAALVNQPYQLNTVSLGPVPQRDQNNPLTFFLPYAVTMIYYVVILMSSSFLLNSVTKEKENRVLEILMLSVTPRQLLVGKIIGLGLVGLMQAALWVGTGYGLLRLSGRAFSLPASFQLPLSFLAWGVVFFLLGYAVYASLMASVGALVPNLREASQATFVVILPLLIPLMMISLLIEDPNGALATGLSLFPLTSPVVMMTRLSATEVPLWQILLSIAFLLASVVLIIRAVAGLFRSQILLSGQEFSLKRLLNALTGRV
jgi:ABC-2 type transport system permease protein